MSIADQLTTIAENVQKVYDAGKAAGGGDSYYDTFWDAYQNNGERTNYQYVFNGPAWNDETFKPKYDIRPAADGYSGSYIFLRSKMKTSEYLKKIDLSQAQSAIQTFAWSTVEELGVIDFGSVTKGWNGLNQTFLDCSTLRKIELLVPPRDTGAGVDAFSGLPALTDITFGGTIYQTISFAASSNLSSASVQSIIDWLADLTGGTAKTLTLHADVGANLTDEQKATVSAKNWTLAY